MTSSDPPRSRFPKRWRKYIYGAILGILTLIVAPFIVEVLKIQYARWIEKPPANPPGNNSSKSNKTEPTETTTTTPEEPERFSNQMLADVNRAIGEERFDDADRLLRGLAQQFRNEQAIRQKQDELKQARQMAYDTAMAEATTALREKQYTVANTAVDRALRIIPRDAAALELQRQIARASLPGQIGDFVGTWDVYLDGKLVRLIELGPIKNESGEYRETLGGAAVARAGYYQLENNGRKLLLFKTGGQLVEQGLVSWTNGDLFTYTIGNSDHEFRRRK
jgi:hypothetical protein